MGAIYSKEIKSYFNNMSGYLFIGFFLAIIGLYHYIYNYVYTYANYAYSLDGVNIFFMVLVPILSMRIMAEENKQKTDQLLLTSPVSVKGIILGKYFAMLSLFLIVMAACCVHPLVMSKFGDVNLPSAYLAIAGFTLMGAAYLAIGLFISSVSESQVFAAVVTFVVILFTCLVDSIVSIFDTDSKTAWIVFAVCLLLLTAVTYAVMRNILVSALFFAVTEITLAVVYLLNSSLLEGSVEKVFGWFSIMSRFKNFYYGVLNLSDPVYYLSLIVLFIFLTVQNVEKRRWN